MSEARAITNLIGNGVATVVVAKSDESLDTVRMLRILSMARRPMKPITGGDTSKDEGRPRVVLAPEDVEGESVGT